MTDKIEPNFPKSSLKVNLKVNGIFAFPDQWRATDQANPGMFTYTLRMANIELTHGKIHPRQLTQKQLREAEQAKNKKGGKKQAKKQQNPAQLEKLKQLQQKQQAQQKKREQLWAKMTDQQKFYYTSQDKHKSAILKFQHNTVQKQFSQKILTIFQEHIEKDGGQWIYLYKTPTANQEQLAKIKKSKPKNLNLNDLNPISIRAWVDLSHLKSSQNKQIQIRCKVHQIDATQQTSKPNLQKTYIKIHIQLNQPLISKQDKYSLNIIIKDPPKPKQLALDIKYVNEMKQQMKLAIQSLAMQYSNMFWKDLNTFQEQKSSQIFITSRKNDHIKRKQQFLYDFNVSGKYKVLKQRLKKVIVHLCQSKFINKMEGNKSFTGITCSVRDQFYSEIYNFLVQSYTQLISQFTQQKKHQLKQVYILNQKNQNKITEQHLQQYKNENIQQKLNRIIKQYNLINNYEYGKNIYKNILKKQQNNINIKYLYSIYCIKNKLVNINDILNEGYIQQYLQYNKNNKDIQLIYILLLIGSQDNKLLKKSWILLRQLINNQPNIIQYYLYASIIAQLLEKGQLSHKFISKAQRIYMRQHKIIKQQNKHKLQPNLTQIPNIHSVAKYQYNLKNQQKDQIWFKVINKFQQFGIYNIINKLKEKIHNKQNIKLLKIDIDILYGQQKYKQCKQKALQLYNKSKNYQILKIIIKCCNKLGQILEQQKYLKAALKISPANQKSQILLNLGYFYYNEQKYGNTKACLTKYIEGNKQTGGLSWQILGISQLKINNIQQAIQCFRFSNLSDPYNKQIWVWLAQAYAKLRNFIMVNQCINCYLDGNNLTDKQKYVIKELIWNIGETKAQSFYDIEMKDKIIQRLKAY